MLLKQLLKLISEMKQESTEWTSPAFDPPVFRSSALLFPKRHDESSWDMELQSGIHLPDIALRRHCQVHKLVHITQLLFSSTPQITPKQLLTTDSYVTLPTTPNMTFEAGPGLLLVFMDLGDKVTEAEFHGKPSSDSLRSSLKPRTGNRMVRRRTHSAEDFHPLDLPDRNSIRSCRRQTTSVGCDVHHQRQHGLR
jgi:hypothetical protein